MPSQQTAIRTCVGCRKRDDQAVLLRLVRDNSDGSNAVVIDDRRRLSGRGAWLHLTPACLEQALKRGAFNRAFRGQVDPREVEDRLHTLKEASLRSHPKETVPPESGSEN
ncbi:YlxR family protein [Arthrobacter sp. 260]|uniref:YlxR family protein n=1 Tax=Arthrobacter sp. 260 TaxID=2735314 RepID=UPI001C0F6F2B|nr:YlxR family protein [Arthrobacter sp. 260]